MAVFFTASNIAEAELLATILVNERLAACVQILPGMTSVYRWQGVVQRESEVLLIAKSTATVFAKLELTVRAHHSYDTPEIVAFPIAQLSAPYAAWLTENVGPEREA
ncbi:MAG: divalent-cation tolerance protein CutA [Pyrinomonadaceae bacterium]